MNRLCEPLEAALDRGGGDWAPCVEAWRDSAAGMALIDFVDARRAADAVIYPSRVLRALEWTPLSRTRVVIVGQDPYHRAGQADGLAFSVPQGVRRPPSLRNILKELYRDLGVETPTSGSLEQWALDGVLLLNTVLTVEEGRPGAHAGRGWEALTDALISAAAADAAPKVFMLWGARAQAKTALIDAQAAQAAVPRHLILSSNHPSPLSAYAGPKPFIGNGHFGQARAFLAVHGRFIASWNGPSEALS